MATGIVTGQPVPQYNQTDASNPFAGYPKLPGESQDAYVKRMYASGVDQNTIKQLIQRTTDTSQKALDTQSNLQKTRLDDLATLLAGQNKAAFNADIPGIAGNAQKAGMLETSGFGQALSTDYANLQREADAKIAQQALSDRDLAIKGTGDIATNANNLDVAGVERQFSTSDQDKANALAMQLGQMGIPAPAAQPSTTDKIINSAGPILSGVGAAKGAGAAV